VFARVINHGGRWLLDQWQLVVAASHRQIDAIAGVGIQGLEIAQVIRTISGGGSSARKSSKGDSGNNDLLHDGFLFLFSWLLVGCHSGRLFGSDEQKIVGDFAKSETPLLTVKGEKNVCTSMACKEFQRSSQA
jgi:hypothetical protein